MQISGDHSEKNTALAYAALKYRPGSGFQHLRSFCQTKFCCFAV